MILLLVILVGGFVRLWDLSLMEFRHDSAYWAIEGYKIAQGGYLPLIGQQVGSVSVELYNGPILSYLVALVNYMTGPNPVHVVIIIASANALGIFMTFALGKYLFSEDVGIIAAVLQALSPWLVLYGRMLWPQALFPFLMPTGLLLLAYATRTTNKWAYFVFGIMLGMGLQLHLSFLAVIATALLFIILYGGRLWLLLLVIVGCLVGYAPVIIFDFSSGFKTIHALSNIPAIQAVDEPRMYHMLKTVWNLTNVVSGQGLWVSKLSKTPYMLPSIDWIQGIVFSLLWIVSLIAILSEYFTQAKHRKFLPDPSTGMLLLFFFLPFLYLLLSKTPIQRHYFLFFFPIPFLIVARGLHICGDVLAKGKPLSDIRNYLVVLLLLITTTLNAVTVWHGYRFLVATGGEGEYGTALADKLHAVNSIMSISDQDYAVDLTYTQERLPYIYLLAAAAKKPLSIDGNIQPPSVIGADESNYFMIVETEYVKEIDNRSLDLFYQSRGVKVYSRLGGIE